MAMVFISINVYLMKVSSILNFVSKDFIEGGCVVALMLAVMIIGWSTFQPLLTLKCQEGPWRTPEEYFQKSTTAKKD
jgi:hypothetical protein